MNRSELLAGLSTQILAIPSAHPVRVAIDGVDGAGKTTLADELVRPLRDRGREVIRGSIDGFHNSRAVRYQRGRLSPDGYFRDSFDIDALRSVLLDPLGPDGDRHYRLATFDYRCDEPVDSPSLVAAPGAILLLDGVFLLGPQLRSHWDHKIFVHVDFGVSVERACRRDAVDEDSRHVMKELYQQRYVPGQKLYLESCRPRESADIEVNNNDPAAPTIRIVSS